MTAVDRTHHLADPRFGHANPDRVHVTRMGTGWWVWRGTLHLRRFRTHTEAIRWARANACIGLHAYIGGQYVGQVGEVEPRSPQPEPRINPTFPEPMEAP